MQSKEGTNKDTRERICTSHFHSQKHALMNMEGHIFISVLSYNAYARTQDTLQSYILNYYTESTKAGLFLQEQPDTKARPNQINDHKHPNTNQLINPQIPIRNKPQNPSQISHFLTLKLNQPTTKGYWPYFKKKNRR